MDIVTPEPTHSSPEPKVPKAVPPPSATPVTESVTTSPQGPGTFSSPGTGEPPVPVRVTIEPPVAAAFRPTGQQSPGAALASAGPAAPKARPVRTHPRVPVAG